MPNSTVGDLFQRERTGDQHLASATTQRRLAENRLIIHLNCIRVKLVPLDEAAVCAQGFWFASECGEERGKCSQRGCDLARPGWDRAQMAPCCSR